MLRVAQLVNHTKTFCPANMGAPMDKSATVGAKRRVLRLERFPRDVTHEMSLCARKPRWVEHRGFHKMTAIHGYRSHRPKKERSPTYRRHVIVANLSRS